MDHDTAYEQFEEALAQQDADAIAETAEALATWLDGGGYLPSGMQRRGFDRHTARQYFRDIARTARSV